jgi:hypothetical protein
VTVQLWLNLGGQLNRAPVSVVLGRFEQILSGTPQFIGAIPHISIRVCLEDLKERLQLELVSRDRSTCWIDKSGILFYSFYP